MILTTLDLKIKNFFVLGSIVYGMKNNFSGHLCWIIIHSILCNNNFVVDLFYCLLVLRIVFSNDVYSVFAGYVFYTLFLLFAGYWIAYIMITLHVFVASLTLWHDLRAYNIRTVDYRERWMAPVISLFFIIMSTTNKHKHHTCINPSIIIASGELNTNTYIFKQTQKI